MLDYVGFPLKTSVWCFEQPKVLLGTSNSDKLKILVQHQLVFVLSQIGYCQSLLRWQKYETSIWHDAAWIFFFHFEDNKIAVLSSQNKPCNWNKITCGMELDQVKCGKGTTVNSGPILKYFLYKVKGMSVAKGSLWLVWTYVWNNNYLIEALIYKLYTPDINLLNCCYCSNV